MHGIIYDFLTNYVILIFNFFNLKTSIMLNNKYWIHFLNWCGRMEIYLVMNSCFWFKGRVCRFPGAKSPWD